MNVAEMSIPTTSIPRRGERQRVPAGPAADVEHPHTGAQAEDVDEESDLLFGAIGEGVPEIGRTEMVGDSLEPMRHGLSLWRRPRTCRRPG